MRAGLFVASWPPDVEPNGQPIHVVLPIEHECALNLIDCALALVVVRSAGNADEEEALVISDRRSDALLERGVRFLEPHDRRAVVRVGRLGQVVAVLVKGSRLERAAVEVGEAIRGSALIDKNSDRGPEVGPISSPRANARR